MRRTICTAKALKQISRNCSLPTRTPFPDCAGNYRARYAERARSHTTLRPLHSVGVEIAIDDFGTGHSALIYLERFTLDYLKIDRGFINAIGTETITSPVLDAVLTLAKRLNMLTVAEGVETPEQARWLSERGVNFMQGYWISRPLPLDDFVRWLKKPYTPQW